MPKIFVSYRRKSSEAITGRILDRLVAHYGKDSIFIDIDNILPGVDFRRRINQVLNETDIMIAVVGPKWLGSGKQARVGMHRENDWVRLEIETALRRNTLVIPVLVDGAQMPDASDLPEHMKDFVYRSAIIVASGQDFHMHVDRLIRAIDQMIASGPSPPGLPLEPVPPEKTVDGSQSRQTAEPETSETAPEQLADLGLISSGALAPTEEAPAVPFPEPDQTVRTSEVESTPEAQTPQGGSLPIAPPEAGTPRYFSRAAAAGLLVAALAGIYGAASYLFPEPHREVAESNTATIVPPPNPSPAAKPVPPAPPPMRTADATGAGAPVPSLPPQGPSCLAKIASVGSGGVGGPFLPVSIRPNLADANMIRAVAVSPTGKEIATAGEDGLIRLWDASSFRLIRTLKGHAGAIYSIDYWIDGTLLASASLDGTVRVWNPTDGSIVQTFDTRSSGDGTSSRQFSAAFYPEAPLKYLASGGDDGIVRIWNTQSGTLESTKLDHQIADGDKSTIRSLSFAPNGSGEFVTAGYDGKIRIYLTTKHQVVALDANAKKVLHVGYSPDSTRIFTAGSDSDVASQNAASLKIWNVKTQSFRPLLGHRDYVVSASWSPDGKRLVSGGGGRDRSVMLWDAESGQPVAAFSGHQSDVEAVAFFAGGSRIVSVGEDKTIKVWSVSDRKEILTAVGFGERDYVVYTPDGCYSGSSGIESRVSMFADKALKPITAEARGALFVPEGFGSLLAGR
jgi:WD40 repeat protein